MDTTKTMRELCDDEPKLESFLQSKGFPFTIDNPSFRARLFRCPED